MILESKNFNLSNANKFFITKKLSKYNLDVVKCSKENDKFVVSTILNGQKFECKEDLLYSSIDQLVSILKIHKTKKLHKYKDSKRAKQVNHKNKEKEKFFYDYVLEEQY